MEAERAKLVMAEVARQRQMDQTDQLRQAEAKGRIEDKTDLESDSKVQAAPIDIKGPTDESEPPLRPPERGIEEIYVGPDGLRVLLSGKAVIVLLSDDRKCQVMAPSGSYLAPTLMRRKGELRAQSIIVSIANVHQPIGAYEATASGSSAAVKNAETRASEVEDSKKAKTAGPTLRSLLADAIVKWLSPRG